MPGRIFLRLENVAERNGLGERYLDLDCWIERNPDTVRGADVARVRAERLQGSGDDEDGRQDGPTDLAVDVTGSRSREVKTGRRIAQLVEAGCPVVWHVMLPDRTVNGHAPRVLREGDVLDGGDFLPGLGWEVAKRFRPGRA